MVIKKCTIDCIPVAYSCLLNSDENVAWSRVAAIIAVRKARF